MHKKAIGGTNKEIEVANLESIIFSNEKQKPIHIFLKVKNESAFCLLYINKISF